ncbi:uncharacterized protein LOC120644096 [Panicum virgatum]|uniref:uncharacterized protein LOC120644096 n=1 Tax=Panicum virgatum TaxID=38727 RepID=UPI0019D58D90|nr:uncharacterized protein LOC120644096 [Panicum virgatum]
MARGAALGLALAPGHEHGDVGRADAGYYWLLIFDSARMMEGHRAGHRKHSKCQLITEKAMVDHEWMHNTWNTCGFFSTSLVRFCSWGGTEVISFKMIRAFYLRNSLSVIKWLGCLCLG